jgi:hypothetical protein
MLQISLQTYASDALEDAMRLAQTKALNSYSFSDCLNYLNYTWMDIFHKIVVQDEGFYSKTVRLTQKLTKLPPFVKNSIRVYAAREPIGYNREVFREAGYNDLQSYNTYRLSGFDLYCPEVTHRTIWLNYIPEQPMIFFPRNNRDPKLYQSMSRQTSMDYNMYTLQTIPGGYQLYYKNRTVQNPTDYDVDITDALVREDWNIVYISCDFPYIFITYQNQFTQEYYSGFFKDMVTSYSWTEYNPFAFTGRNSNVEYVRTTWNDKTGMGSVVIDHNDGNQIKELGWTPDTLLVYPSPEMYRLLVARLADKFSALNETNVMGVQKELIEATYAFDNFTKKDKSAWRRIDNVNGPNLSDIL